MRRYCLHCFTTLPDESDVCRACGRASPPAMRRRFWSLHRRHRQDEVAAKVAVVVFVLAVGGAVVAWVAHGPATGPGAGFVIVLPIALGVALWSNAEKFTRHRTNFRAAVFWGALGACCTGLLAWLGAFLPAGVAALATVLILILCRIALRWKQALVAGTRTP
jgi:uncharacterized membrane protein YfcA